MDKEGIDIKKPFWRNLRPGYRIIAIIASFFIVFLPGVSSAVTRGEFAALLFKELGYAVAADPYLPPDVKNGSPFAKQIGSAARYGLIPKAAFAPDETLDRHGAVRLAISMMGWDFEVSLYESLNSLPDLAGTGDSVFFLAAEMNPPAPSALLVDGSVPLSDSGAASILKWVAACRDFVSWNRVVSYNGTDFIIYRQGIARPGVPNVPGSDNPVGSRKNDPLYVAAIGMNMNYADARVAWATALGTDRAALSDFVRAYEPIGAVNGGFFSNSRPLGTMVFDGHPAGRSLEGRSAIGWNNRDGTFVFGPGVGRIGVKTPGGFVQFDHFNVTPQMNEASFYPAGVMIAAAGTALDALELAVKNGHVLEKREGSWGNHFLPDGGSLIVARGNSRALLESYKQGDPLTVSAEWDTRSFEYCDNVIQAGPILTRNGQRVADNETFKADITGKRHPRTIVGTDGSRLIWAVVDGRNSVHSLGTTIDETRWVASALGLTTAVNMDGGGSSELIWRGIIANIPSDGKERPLPYAVLAMPKGAPLERKNFQEAP
ncbi:MAG: phosphodiester glycosidase family protein, partial [Synergistaceae bacterium]|nr:phosphodiester glycosidase family protein [Synergistaceae bacterium]